MLGNSESVARVWFFVLNTYLLLSPMMKSVNLGLWHKALEKMLLFFTEVSNLFCKESFLLISNSDFHCATEKNRPPHFFFFFKETPPSHSLRKYSMERLQDFVSCKGFCNIHLMASRWTETEHKNGSKYLRLNLVVSCSDTFAFTRVQKILF